MTTLINTTPNKQQGIALIMALIFLVVMTLLGLSAMNGNVMQERMVGNSKDMNLALQAAEAGLRNAEADVAANITPATVFAEACPSGLCTPPTTWVTPDSRPMWLIVNWSVAAGKRVYGVNLAAAAIPNVAAQPLYVIELLAAMPSGVLGLNPPPITMVYRITVYATGARAETHVVLQSTYIKI